MEQMKTWSIRLAIALGALAVAACGESDDPWVRNAMSESEHFVVHAESDPGVPRVGENTVFLSVTDPDGVPATGASIEVEPWMPHHGHGTESVPVVTELGEGEYEVANVVYNMSGMWELRTELTTPEHSDRVVLDVDVP